MADFSAKPPDPDEVLDPSDALITVQIPESEIYDLPPDYQADPNIQRRPSWVERRFSRTKKEETVGVRMRKGEFFNFFVKDKKTGEYREGVIEPPGGRKAWLQRRLEEQESWPPAQYNYQARGKLDSQTLAPTDDGSAGTGRDKGVKGNVRGIIRSAAEVTAQQQGTYLRPNVRQ